MIKTVAPIEAVDRLLALPAFGVPDADKSAVFLDAVVQQLRHHYEHSTLYRRFCDQRQFNPARIDSLAYIPPVPVQAFKELGARLSAVDEPDIQVRLKSSATRGPASVVPVDRTTARRQARALGHVMNAVVGQRRVPFWIFDVAPITAGKEVSARIAATRGFLSVASSADYLLTQSDDGQLQLDLERLRLLASEAEARGTPVCLFGFTYILFESVVGALRRSSTKLKLPHGSKVIHIGGWKKLANRGITSRQFGEQASEVFGIEPADVVDVYGFTEQLGLIYPTCRAGFKHVPAYSEIIIRNPLSMQSEPDGTAGVIELITPLPHSYPGVAVVTDDQGRIVGRGQCECGWHGTRFEVLGRLESAELRGCGDVIAELTTPHRSAPAQPESGRIQLHFYGGAVAESIEVDRLAVIAAELRAAQAALAKVGVDDIVALISAAAERWESAEHPLAHLRQHGLSFMAAWCKPERLRRMLDASFGGSRAILDGFRPDTAAPKRQVKAVSRGLVAHWLAGNAPTLGMLSVLGSLLSKNASIVKVPSASPHALPVLLKDLSETSTTTPGGRRLYGEVLGRSIAVVQYGRGHTAAAIQMSQVADMRVAWGGADAVHAISNLPKRDDAEDLIFGPKLSLMVIARESLTDVDLVRILARRAAVDCSAFEQYACSSPHTVFVERGSAVTPRAFAEELSRAMSTTLTRLPKAQVDGALVDRIQSARMRHLATGDFIGPAGLEWSVYYDDREDLAAPVYYRNVFVRAVDDIMQVPALLSSRNQTVGIAIEGSRRLAFVEAAAARGVARFPTIGHMTDYDAPWDGAWPIARMVRFISIGPPI